MTAAATHRDILRGVAKAGTATAATVVLSVVAAKLIAVGAGPAGTGAWSLVAQTVQTAAIFCALGGTSLIQGISSREGADRDAFLGKAGRLLILITALVGLAIASGAPLLARSVLGTRDPGSADLARWLAVPVVLSGLLVLMQGILNGQRAIGRLGLANVAGAVAGAALAYPLALRAAGGQEAAWIVLLGCNTGVSLAFATAFAAREGWLAPLLRGGRLGGRSAGFRASEFFALSASTMASGLMTAGTILAIRALLTREGGLSSAGLFAASWSVGVAYITLLINALGTYYVPTLSGTREPDARVALIGRFFRFATLAMVPILVALTVFKPLVIGLLYDASFLPATATARWMFVGDYFKVCGWVLAVPMVAFAHSAAFFWSELIWNVAFLAGTAWAIAVARWDEGIGVIFMALYAVYFVYAWLFVRICHGFRFEPRQLATWWAGLALLGGASAWSWNQTAVHWPGAVAWCLAAVGFSWVALSGWERKEVLRAARRIGS